MIDEHARSRIAALENKYAQENGGEATRQGRQLAFSAGAEPTIDGTGWFASPNGETWDSGTTYYHAGTVNAGVLQVGVNTSGEMLFGAGNGTLDADGLLFNVPGAGTTTSAYKIRWGGDEIAIWGDSVLSTTTKTLYESVSDTTANWKSYIRRTSTGGSTGTGQGSIVDTVNGGGNAATSSLVANSSDAYFQATPVIRLPEGSAPGTPASGNGYIYFKTDSLPYAKNDAGTEMALYNTFTQYGFPQSCTVFATEMVFSATTATTIDTGQMYNYYIGPSAVNAADGDTIDMSFVVAAGTYSLIIRGCAVAQGGITDGYLDGSLSAAWTGDDWYQGGITQNQSFTHAVTFATSGRHTLQLKVNGKNASSSDYRVLLTTVVLKKTAYTVDAQ